MFRKSLSGKSLLEQAKLILEGLSDEEAERSDRAAGMTNLSELELELESQAASGESAEENPPAGSTSCSFDAGAMPESPQLPNPSLATVQERNPELGAADGCSEACPVEASEAAAETMQSPEPQPTETITNYSSFQIVGKHVVLRQLLPADAPSIARHANSSVIQRYVRNDFPSPYTVENAMDFISKQAKDAAPFPNLGIALNREIVGNISIHIGTGVRSRSGEVGWWIGEGFEDYMGDAMILFLRYVLESFPNIERLEACVLSYNLFAKQTLETAGFKFEARLKKYYYKNDRLIDALMYCRLRDYPASPLPMSPVSSPVELSQHKRQLSSIDFSPPPMEAIRSSSGWELLKHSRASPLDM